jgi:Ala-tRNA(Pro) deacylase
MTEDPVVLARLQQALDAAGIAYRRIEHEPIYTSEQAAEVRGTPLHSGAKALVVKGMKGDFMLAVMPADLGLAGTKFRKLIGSRRLRFATEDELRDLTGLAPGSVPPFGSLFGLKTICDERLADNERIVFSAGSHTVSLQMSYADYVEFENPRIAAITKPEQ